VGDPIGKVDGAVDRINDPTIFLVRVAEDAFLTQNGDLWEVFAQGPFNHLLAAHIQLQLDVVLG
jgi:hypothetical protein